MISRWFCPLVPGEFVGTMTRYARGVCNFGKFSGCEEALLDLYTDRLAVTVETAKARGICGG